MKPFSVYLQQSHKLYEFKVKIAGDGIESKLNKDIALALDEFKCVKVSPGKRLPIAETHADFPEHKNIEVTMFEVTLAYPATSMQLRDKLSTKLHLSFDQIKVRNLKEQEEMELNQHFNEPSGKAVIGTDYEPSDHQDLVGDKWISTFLAELNKDKHQGEQYKGVNDQILAKGAPQHVKETPGKQVDTKINNVNVFTKQVKISDPLKGVK